MVQAKDISDIMKMDDVHKIYFNEFGLGVSQNDVFIVLRRNGREEAVINTSHIRYSQQNKVPAVLFIMSRIN